jgi:hypothetical protein
VRCAVCEIPEPVSPATTAHAKTNVLHPVAASRLRAFILYDSWGEECAELHWPELRNVTVPPVLIEAKHDGSPLGKRLERIPELKRQFPIEPHIRIYSSLVKNGVKAWAKSVDKSAPRRHPAIHNTVCVFFFSNLRLSSPIAAWLLTSLRR